jgi:hypothetical protein
MIARISALGLAAVLAFAPVAAAQTYDVSTGFSTDANPAGPWSYAGSTTLTGPLMTFGTHIDFGGGAVGWGVPPYWSVCKNTSGSDLAVHGTTSIPAGQVFLHPENADGYYANAVFTAPAAGSYAIAATFKGVSTAVATTTDVHVLMNTTVLDSGGINIGTFGPTWSFTQTVTLAAGDQIRFAVGRGNGDWSFDSTGLDATITATTTNPPPPPPTTDCSALEQEIAALKAERDALKACLAELNAALGLSGRPTNAAGEIIDGACPSDGLVIIAIDPGTLRAQPGLNRNPNAGKAILIRQPHDGR